MGRKEHADAQKAHIIEAAIRVLAHEGIHAATTRKIATEAGINQATQAYYFGSKDQLLLEVLQSLIQQTHDIVLQAIPEDGIYPQVLRQALLAYWQYVEDMPEIQHMQQELTLYVLREPTMAWVATEQYKDYARLIVSLLQKYLEESKTMSFEELARFITSGLDGLILQYLSDRNRPTAQRRIAYLIEATEALVMAHDFHKLPLHRSGEGVGG